MNQLNDAPQLKLAVSWAWRIFFGPMVVAGATGILTLAYVALSFRAEPNQDFGGLFLIGSVLILPFIWFFIGLIVLIGIRNRIAFGIVLSVLALIGSNTLQLYFGWHNLQAKNLAAIVAEAKRTGDPSLCGTTKDQNTYDGCALVILQRTQSFEDCLSAATSIPDIRGGSPSRRSTVQRMCGHLFDDSRLADVDAVEDCRDFTSGLRSCLEKTVLADADYARCLEIVPTADECHLVQALRVLGATYCMELHDLNIQAYCIQQLSARVPLEMILATCTTFNDPSNGYCYGQAMRRFFSEGFEHGSYIRDHCASLVENQKLKETVATWPTFLAGYRAACPAWP